MKKITILSLHLGFGGIERSVASLANMLSPNYEVEIVSIYKLYNNPSFKINDNVVIKYLLSDNLKPNKKEIKIAIKKHKLLTLIREIIKSFKILYLKRKTMIEYIKNCHSDVIISTRDIFNEWLGKYGNSDILRIGWEHNHYHGNLKYAKKIVNSCRKLDNLVLVSSSLNDFYSDRMKKYSCKTIFIPNVIEEIPDYSASLKDKRLISVGRLSQEKGFDDLLKIFKLVHETNKDWKLDIIGAGDEYDNLLQYIKQNNLENSIILHGFKEKDYIYNLLNHSSIYLMTSHTESFGIVLLEAMSVGVPCIAFSSAEGANELIINGYNGYLVQNRNIDEYVNQVNKLIENYEERKLLGKNAKESIKRYSADTVKSKWINLIEKR